MEKYKKIGKNIFVSVLPWFNDKFVVQASGGTPQMFFRGRSKPINFNSAIKAFRKIKTKTGAGRFIHKNAITIGE